MNNILATIPAFNEEEAVAEVIKKTQQFASEVWVVDDGSSDGTSEMARSAGAKVVKHRENRGYGAALQTCLRVALLRSPDVLVIVDGDGQHDPLNIPAVTTPILRGEADVSVGSRFNSSIPRGVMPLYRRLGIHLITVLVNLKLGDSNRVRDSQSGFRAYSPSAIKGLLLTDTGMSASVEILWRADALGLRIRETPLDMRRYRDVVHMNPMLQFWSVIRGTLRLVSLVARTSPTPSSRSSASSVLAAEDWLSKECLIRAEEMATLGLSSSGGPD